MKKFLSVLFFCAAALISTAQIRTVSAKDTNTNAVTSYANFYNTGSKVQSFTYVVTKVSGTVAGTVILQGTDDGTNWFDLDTLTLANQATNAKVFLPEKTYYNSYRAKFTTSGTQVSYLVAALVRRPDE